MEDGRPRAHRTCWSGLLMLVIASSHAVAAPDCDFSATSGICSGVVGEGFPHGSYSNVDTLFLVHCDLSLLSAHAFAPFHRVTALYLNKCTLPPADRHPLVKLPQLQELHITCAGPQGEQELGALVGDAKELRSLIMHRCGLRRVDVALVGQLPHLRTLDLRHNAVERVDAAALAALRELRLLRLEHNLLREAPALEETHVAVWLDGNPLCDARPPGGEDAFLEAACVPEKQRSTPHDEAEEEEEVDEDVEEEEDGVEGEEQVEEEGVEEEEEVVEKEVVEEEEVKEEVKEDVEEVEEDATTVPRPLKDEEHVQEAYLLMHPRGPIRVGPAEDETSLWTVAVVGFGAGAACALLFSVVLVVVRRRNEHSRARTDLEAQAETDKLNTGRTPGEEEQ